jgi:hypothetical protein
MANDVSTITKPATKSGAKPGMKAGYSSAKKPVMVPGRRDFFAYRDLGVKDASNGTMRAQLTTAITGMTQPTGWHYHVCDHQFVLRAQGLGRARIRERRDVPARSRRLRHIPGGLNHNELRTSDDLEILEVVGAGRNRHRAGRPAGQPRLAFTPSLLSWPGLARPPRQNLWISAKPGDDLGSPVGAKKNLRAKQWTGGCFSRG